MSENLFILVLEIFFTFVEITQRSKIRKSLYMNFYILFMQMTLRQRSN